MCSEAGSSTRFRVLYIVLRVSRKPQIPLRYMQSSLRNYSMRDYEKIIPVKTLSQILGATTACVIESASKQRPLYESSSTNRGD